MSMESHSGIVLTGENRRTRRETCPSSTLSTTSPISTDPGANPWFHGERPTSNRLSHGTAEVAFTVIGLNVGFLPLCFPTKMARLAAHKVLTSGTFCAKIR
jgi:hypothetical protein